MPRAARCACNHAGCLIAAEANGFCKKHANDALLPKRWDSETSRSKQSREAARLYATKDWQRLRTSHLREHPFCEDCKPRLVQGTDVDHKVPHRGSVQLFFDESNLQTLCHSCHSRKTLREFNDASPAPAPARQSRRTIALC
jgi:5-methylcytosine-specific restriction enzyme A